ncbi:MAG: ATP-binding protein [Thermoplasmatota archaeon]
MQQKSCVHILERPAFIDRVDERKLVLEALSSARNGKGGTILVEGEAGIGKTRFIEECMTRARELGFRILQGTCLDYRRSAYLPFVEMIREYFGISLERLEKENIELLADSIGKEFDGLKAYSYDLLDFFFPHDELFGAYRSNSSNDEEILRNLREKGYRMMIIGDTEGFKEKDSLGGDTTVVRLGGGEKGSIDPKRIEKLATTIKGAISECRHCAVLFNGFDHVMEKNPPTKVEKLVKIAGDLSARNSGVIVFSSNDMENAILKDIPLLEPDCTPPRRANAKDLECMNTGKIGISIYELLPIFFKEIAVRDPLMIVIENLQWSDKATRNLIQFLSRDVRSERILLVGSYRSEESTIEGQSEGQISLKETLRRMTREHLFNTVSLERFDVGTSGELAASISGKEMDIKQLDTMMGETGGNPRFIIDFLKRAMAHEETEPAGKGSDRTSDEHLTVNRIKALADTERKVLEMAAVMGENITADKLATSLDLEIEKVLDPLDKLIEMKFLRENGELFEFEQLRIRDSILDGIQPDIRKLMHGRIAEVLTEEASTMNSDVDLSLAVHHYYSGDYQTALSQLIVRCGQLMLDGEMEKALSTLNMAYDCIENMEDSEDRSRSWAEVLRMEADIQDAKGNFEKGITSLKKAIEISEKNGLNIEVPIYLRRMGDLLLKRYEWETTIEHYLRALHLSKRHNNDHETSMAFRGLGRVYLLKGEYDRAMDFFIKYMEFPEARSGRDHLLGLIEIGDIYFQMGDFNQALAYYKLAIQKGEESRLPGEIPLAQVKMANTLLRLGEVEESRRYGEFAVGNVISGESSSAALETMLLYVDLMLELGDLEKAEEVTEEIEGSIDGLDLLLRSTAYRLKGMIFSRRRDFRSSFIQMKASISTLEEIDVPYHLAVSYFNFGLIRFQQMDVEGALEMLKKASEIFKGIKSMHFFNRTSSKMREVSFIREGLRS